MDFFGAALGISIYFTTLMHWILLQCGRLNVAVEGAGVEEVATGAGVEVVATGARGQARAAKAGTVTVPSNGTGTWL